MDEFNALMNSITNVYLAGMNLPPLKSSASDLRGTELWNRMKLGGTDDIKRRLDDLPWGYDRKDKEYGTDPVREV